MVYVGVVTRAHPTQGTIQLRIQNGFELDELHDVAISSKTNNDLLAYESSTSLWKNKSFSTLGLLTSSTAASTYAPLASPSFTGTPLSTTAAADTNTTQIATTAYVVGQASATTPVVNGTATIGTSLKYARADHIHPTDTSRAALASPTFTGTPLSTTATADTNTTQIATTAYVVGQASATTPAATGTAAVGTSLKYARADHVHSNPLPTGGTTGQVLAKIDATNYNVQWTTAGSGSGAAVIDIQTFSTAGTYTWTKPTGAKLVVGYMFGSGGGGGAGGRNATSAIRGGGAGGAGGALLKFSIDASALSATETVTIGAGGLGGTSATTDATAGNSGSSGNTTIFGSKYRTYYAYAGGGGTLTAVSPGASSSTGTLEGIVSNTTTINAGGNGTLTGGSGASFSYINYYYPSGGGGGAGAGAGLTASAAGGAGGTKPTASGFAQGGLATSVAGGTGGTSAGVAPTSGTAGSLAIGGGTGGGGGAYRTGVAGMAGANGGAFGGGGGGGSASDNGFASGAGGNGGDGALILITYF
jgi:hypothetical protein